MSEPSTLEPPLVPSMSPESEVEYKKNLKQLRREWKWAAASDFLYKFNPMLHLDFLDLSDVEHDILSGASDTIMTVFLKILHVLTSIRGLSHDTWEQYLRRLYFRRDPENAVWGTEEVPVAWKDMAWINRLGILHDLCEWQFQNPLRVRQSMKDDGDEPEWRSSPIGRDAQRNEYWHLGRHRLWIKRPVNELPPPPDIKGKKPSTKGKQKASKRKAMTNGSSKKPSPKKTKQPTLDRFFKPSKNTEKQQQASGTRISSRLMRGGGSDGWQKIPDEWLNDPSTSSMNPDGSGVNGMEALFDDASDLTDLSDDNKPPADSGTGSSKANPPDDSDSELTDMEDDINEIEESSNNTKAGPLHQDPNSPDFVEFETICVTLTEWKEFAERFKVTRSLNERRLHRSLTMILIPEMEEHQRAVQEKRDKELKEMLKREQAAAAAAAAEARPKRSTRLAALVDDDQERKRQGSIDGDSSDGLRGMRSSRIRRAAIRGARWIAEQEQMLAAMSTEGDDNEDEDEEKQGEEGEEKPKKRRKKHIDQDEYRDEDEEEEAEAEQAATLNGRGRPRRAAAVQADLKRPVRSTRRRRVKESDDEADSDEPLFLNCEICKKSGWNEDGSQQLISCGDCGILQHIACYDRADKLEGKPKRNWIEEKFLCSSCFVKAQSKRPRRGRRHKETQSIDETDAGMLDLDLPETQDRMDIVQDDLPSSSFTSIQAPPSSRSAGSFKSDGVIEDASMDPASPNQTQQELQPPPFSLQTNPHDSLNGQTDRPPVLVPPEELSGGYGAVHPSFPNYHPFVPASR
ncbi:hypothetical protein FRC17_006927 [Serendipita sp. 399]|nr:hypothetical protein FRC17_006927 [Serendipita sp. 399]